MKRLVRMLSVILLSMLITVTPIFITLDNPAIISVEAHSGRTDSSGGHKDNKNKSGLGSYHYHCGGHPAHLHTNGVCPYSTSTTTSSQKTSKNSTSSTAKTNKAKSSASSKVIKKVQKALNELGYDCGKADGILGKKTKAALKKFQEDNELKVDGIIGKQVKKALNIT